jgi:NAD(P)H-hydrate epimerase
MTDQIPVPQLPERPPDAHKGTFGTVVVVGGSAVMIGAPAIAAHAGLRAGAGLVRIAAPLELLAHALTIEPAATGIDADHQHDPDQAAESIDRELDDKSVLAIGPGIGRGPAQQALVEALLRRPTPAVLDADGLNNLAILADAPMVPRCPLVMTPHPGEYKRLADAAAIHHDPLDPESRPQAAAAMAQTYNAVLVLKGQHTVVSDGDRHYVNHTGNPALATAGSGDVLTGAIAALIAQGMTRFDAAVLAVYLHGLAADHWTQSHGPAGLVARDLAAALPQAMQQHRHADQTPTTAVE